MVEKNKNSFMVVVKSSSNIQGVVLFSKELVVYFKNNPIPYLYHLKTEQDVEDALALTLHESMGSYFHKTFRKKDFEKYNEVSTDKARKAFSICDQFKVLDLMKQLNHIHVSAHDYGKVSECSINSRIIIEYV